MAFGCFWDQAPNNVTLARDNVYVWCCSLDQPENPVRRLSHLLSTNERAKAERYHFERHKRRYVVSQAVLRLILGRHLDIDPQEIGFKHGPNGKPFVTQMLEGASVYFNLSHSHELAIYAVTLGRELGIDLEFIRPVTDAEPIIERYFSNQEKIVFRALAPEEKQEAFFNAWTRKEAYLKGIGAGLNNSLDGFTVSLAPGEPAQLLHVEGEKDEPSKWSLQSLIPAEGYIGALVVEGHGWNLILCKFDEPDLI